MADTLPKFIDGLSYSGLSLRRGDVPTVMHDGTTVGVRAGVRPGANGLRTTLSGTTITVAAGVAVLQYQSGQGAYRVCLPGSMTKTMDAPHATLSRIDLVYLRVWDTLVDASGQNLCDVVYLAGTAASSPVAPVPTGTQIYIPLAQITVPPSGGGSASVSTAVMPYTVAAGGILPSSTAPTTPYTGQYYDDGNDLQRWNGSSWDTYVKTPGAWTTYTPSWTAVTTNPARGNGTIAGRYSKVGRTVHCQIKLVTGSTTTYGSGAYAFGLPFASAAASTDTLGVARLTAGSTYTGQVSLDAGASTCTATFPVSGTAGTAANLAQGAPTTLAAGHILRITLAYESAT